MESVRKLSEKQKSEIGYEDTTTCESGEENLNICHKNRGRTPSGNPISIDFNDIRGYFSPSNSKKRKRSEIVSKVASKEKNKNNSKSSQSKKPLKQNVARKLKGKARRLAYKRRHASVNTNPNKAINTFIESDSDSFCTLSPSASSSNFESVDSDVSDTFLYYLDSELRTMSHNKQESATNVDVNSSQLQGATEALNNQPSMSDRAQVPEEMEMQQSERNIAENPAVVGALTVAEMFKQLKQEMSKEIQAVKTELVSQIGATQTPENVSQVVVDKCVETALAKIDESKIQENQEIAKLKDDVKHFKFRNRALTDVVDRMGTEINELKTRLENLEVSGSKRAITLSGYYIQASKKYEVILELERFFSDNMGLSVKIDDYYTMGIKDPKLVVIYFQTMQDKRDTMRFKSELKGLINEDNRPFFVNDYLPASTQEKRHHERQIINDYSNLEVKYTKNGLAIQGETYKKRVSEPTPKDIVDQDPADLKEILDMETKFSEPMEKEKSIFQGYIASVSSFVEIRKLYIKLRLLQPGARHIVCAYNIKNDSDPDYYTQNYCDDGEAGAGKIVLEVLKKYNLLNRVIFITRKYGGLRMGSERFECYSNMAKKVADEYTWNEVLKIQQNLQQDETNAQQQEQGLEKKRPASSPVFRNPKRGGYALNKSQQRRYIKPSDSIRGARRSTQNGRGASVGNSRGRYSPRQEQLNKYRSWSSNDQREYYARGYKNNYQDNNYEGYATYEDWQSEKDGSFYAQSKSNGISREIY